MSKLCFLDHLGKAVAKSRVREMCRLMELSDIETRLMLERFCDRKTMLQCDFLPERQQKDMVPYLESKVAGWFEANIDYFQPSEWRAIFKSIAAQKIHRAG